MQAFEEFKNMDQAFWAFIKYISEKLGYTERGTDNVKVYELREILDLCQRNGINASGKLIQDACIYIRMRAELLNDFVETMLMDAATARKEFSQWEQWHRIHNYYCKLPMNKQRGDMRQVAFFTAIINILAEKTIEPNHAR